jgi:hypothetical protein
LNPQNKNKGFVWMRKENERKESKKKECRRNESE